MHSAINKTEGEEERPGAGQAVRNKEICFEARNE